MAEVISPGVLQHDELADFSEVMRRIDAHRAHNHTLDGVVVGSRTTKSGTRLVEVHVPEPAVVLWAEGEAPVGEPVRIRLRAAEPEAGKLFLDVV